MTPTFEPGDRLLVLRVPVRVGDVAVAPDPREPARSLVKRVVALDDGAAVLRGDNPDASTDSRAFGQIPVETVRGRVVYRYFPPSRRGRIGRLVP